MNTSFKKTLVLGASTNPSRYSYLALNRLINVGHPVLAIGRKAGKVNEVVIETEMHPIPDLDTVTVYLNANNQVEYYDYLISLKPKRVIFNPGAENDELADKLTEIGIQPVEACTLVLLSTGQY